MYKVCHLSFWISRFCIPTISQVKLSGGTWLSLAIAVMERHPIQEHVGGNYEQGSVFVCVLMAAISFDGTLPVCSCAYVNICGWKGALLKTLFCLNVWVGFCMCFSLYWRICLSQFGVTGRGKSQLKPWRQARYFLNLAIHNALYMFFFPIQQHDSQSAPADCNLLAVTSDLNIHSSPLL